MILRRGHQQLSLILFVFDLSKNMTESIWKNNFYSLKMSIAKKKLKKRDAYYHLER